MFIIDWWWHVWRCDMPKEMRDGRGHCILGGWQTLLRGMEGEYPKPDLGYACSSCDWQIFPTKLEWSREEHAARVSDHVPLATDHVPLATIIYWRLVHNMLHSVWVPFVWYVWLLQREASLSALEQLRVASSLSNKQVFKLGPFVKWIIFNLFLIPHWQQKIMCIYYYVYVNVHVHNLHKSNPVFLVQHRSVWRGLLTIISASCYSNGIFS